MNNPFRTTYRQLSDDEKALINSLKDAAEDLLELLEKVDDPRYRALAKTALEESVMWGTKGITG